ncbi:MAG TPA: LytR C-terminal domain-containing protein [Mycobacteriales bacterium]
MTRGLPGGVTGRRVRRPDLAAWSRNALGGVVAVTFVAGGILALQAVVPSPERRDGPVVKAPPLTGRPTPSAGARSPSVPTAAASPTGTPTARPTDTALATPSATPAARPALTVLNNSRISGLAARAARDFEAGGWRVAATGNLRGRTPRTTVYYDPGQQGAAAALRRQFPRIADARPRPAGLPGTGTLTVVVTRDYAS